MSKMYRELADVYEAMYRTFMDYVGEYQYYGAILAKHHKRRLLELGSGTGALAQLFVEAGWDYQGLEYSPDMVEMARTRYSSIPFQLGDMRDFAVTTPLSACIMTGRTSSHLITQMDVLQAFRCVYDSLEDGGIFCFDVIDAERFIPFIHPLREVDHPASFDGVDYMRKSYWSPVWQDGFCFNWKADYYRQGNDGASCIGQDEFVIRAFTKDEVSLLLSVAGFQILDIHDRGSYAFPTWVFVAMK